MLRKRLLRASFDVSKADKKAKTAQEIMRNYFSKKTIERSYEIQTFFHKYSPIQFWRTDPGFEGEAYCI